MRFRDIPPFTRSSKYRVDIPWITLESQLANYARDTEQSCMTFELDPDFQRAHVWTREKQIAYVEFVLRGGKSSLEIYFNCPGWQSARPFPKGGRMVLVDGKQRVEAVRAFLRGDIPVFGAYYKDFEDKLSFTVTFSVHINDLETDAEVLQWYLDLNDGGVVHTAEELSMVRGLLAAAKASAPKAKAAPGPKG